MHLGHECNFSVAGDASIAAALVRQFMPEPIPVTKNNLVLGEMLQVIQTDAPMPLVVDDWGVDGAHLALSSGPSITAGTYPKIYEVNKTGKIQVPTTMHLPVNQQPKIAATIFGWVVSPGLPPIETILPNVLRHPKVLVHRGEQFIYAHNKTPGENEHEASRCTVSSRTIYTTGWRSFDLDKTTHAKQLGYIGGLRPPSIRAPTDYQNDMRRVIRSASIRMGKTLRSLNPVPYDKVDLTQPIAKTQTLRVVDGLYVVYDSTAPGEFTVQATDARQQSVAQTIRLASWQARRDGYPFNETSATRAALDANSKQTPEADLIGIAAGVLPVPESFTTTTTKHWRQLKDSQPVSLALITILKHVHKNPIHQKPDPSHCSMLYEETATTERDYANIFRRAKSFIKSNWWQAIMIPIYYIYKDDGQVHRTLQVRTYCRDSGPSNAMANWKLWTELTATNFSPLAVLKVAATVPPSLHPTPDRRKIGSHLASKLGKPQPTTKEAYDEVFATWLGLTKGRVIQLRQADYDYIRQTAPTTPMSAVAGSIQLPDLRTMKRRLGQISRSNNKNGTFGCYQGVLLFRPARQGDESTMDWRERYAYALPAE
jgi:hypothetical protein